MSQYRDSESARPAASAQPGPQGTHPSQPDPFGKVLHLGGRARRLGIAVGVLGALCVHGTAAAKATTVLLDLASFAALAQRTVEEQLHAQVDIDMSEPEPEAPEPEPEPEPEPVAPEPEPEPEPTVSPEQAEPEEPAPAAAEAGKVLTAEPDPDEPLDLTDQGFVTGTGDRYAGGITASTGTSDTAVRNRKARGDGVKGGRGAGPASSAPKVYQGPDRSQPALPQGSNWNCPFPAEADAEQVNQSAVTLVVLVGTNGRAKSVTVVSDPGYGFGREARRCAFSKTYDVARNKRGQPVAQTTAPFVVRFSR